VGERRPGRDRKRDHDQRLTLAEAASVLGLSKDGVRMRVRRGTLRSEKGEDGRVYVFVTDQEATTHATATDEPRREVEACRELIEALRKQVEDLRSRLDRETEANRENRRIIAGLIERVPELEAPREAPGASETVEEEPERAEEDPRTRAGEAQAATQHQQAQRPTEGVEHDASTLREWSGDVEGRRRPWWRRVLGG
jgi:chromosome segregation ATPase